MYVLAIIYCIYCNYIVYIVIYYCNILCKNVRVVFSKIESQKFSPKIIIKFTWEYY